MALIHTQHHPFYYPPRFPFLIHSGNQLQPKPPVPLPASLSPPPPPSSSITIKMAHAPPFNPQSSSPRPEAKESVRLPPLLPVAPTVMAHPPFYHLSCAQPPPMPQVSAALLPRTIEFQRSALPDPVHQTYFFYQPPYPLAPAFSAVPSTGVPPPPAPLYYAPAAASPFRVERATKVDSAHQEDGVTAGVARGWVARAGKAGGVFFPTRQSRLQRRCTWSWVPKEEAERRRHLGGLNIRRSPGASSSSPSSSESPSESTFFSASSSSDSPAVPLSLEFDESLAEQETRTTLMMKNIPNKYRREMLMKLLDDHCMEVNNQIEPDSPDGPPSEYDFVYLPMDFRTNSCLGYAFVNFTTAAAAWRFYQALNNFKWEMFGTKKITRICYARIQGKEAMLANFGASSFRCDSDEYLPVTFSPPRSGAEPCPPPTLVGKRWPRSTNTPRQQLLQQAAAATAAGAPDISSSSFSSTPARSSRKT